MFGKRLRSKKRRFFAPDGHRIYAIGDVHGCADLLDDLIEMIAVDNRARTPMESSIIFLGDLVDRGPDSARVVTTVRSLCREAGVARLIKGNHEDVFIRAAEGNAQAAKALLGMGGLPTLLSYGITKEEAEYGSHEDLAGLIARRIPPDDIAFLRAAENMIQLGDYLFVHAGIRPKIALTDQKPSDLFWIRESFLESRIDHGMLVVHGHSVTERIDEQPNRIGIDTGAFASGILSAIGIEGEQRWFLQTSGSRLTLGAD